MGNLNFRNAEIRDLDRCYEIETGSYEGDEAATREKIRTRIETWPDGFLVAENEDGIVGFINSGACHQVALSDEAFKELVGHDPAGKHVVIMSVVVHPDHQKQGIAGKMMMAFLSRMRSIGKEDVHLICQERLVGMYARFGFEYLGESDSGHGGMRWHEMVTSL